MSPTLLQRAMRFHEIAERNKRMAHPCKRCGTDQVEIVDAIAGDWRCRLCGHEWHLMAGHRVPNEDAITGAAL